jgi:asparagine synthase (glutamine-hydrolysing)
MCGIAGFFEPHAQAIPARVTEMCNRIIHRGPDETGVFTDGGCGIGMRRLAIVDLLSGQQPMSNEDGTIWVVFNGEIYNYPELRASLEAKGHRFRTDHSDTETLVHLWEEYGTDSPSHLRGMFAYAIWDRRKQQVFLARDRFGKKPLYYAAVPSGLYFGSELKCLRDSPIPWDLDEEALRLYFMFRYIPDPASPFRAVRKVPAAGWLLYDSDGAVKQGKYWRLPAPATEAQVGMTRAGAVEQLVSLFDESVRIRLMSDVPLGAFLSGGLDSTSVVASMAQQNGGAPVRTFTIGFAESQWNETELARLVAEQYKTDHHELLVKPDCIELVETLTQHFDEPFGDSSAVPTLLVSRFAAQHVKVALTGDGGDEIFAGYDTLRELQKLRKWDRIPLPGRRVLAAMGEMLPYSAYGKNFLRTVSRSTALQRYFELNYVPYFLRKQLLRPEWMLPADAAFLTNRFSECLLQHEDDAILQAMFFEALTNLTGDMLVKVDRMSMAASLEVRSPLLDHRLAEFAMSLPLAWKLGPTQGKLILREALGPRLPNALLQAPKRGFAVPFAQWFRGPLRGYLEERLFDPSFLQRGFVSPTFLRALVDEHMSGRRDNYHMLWSLLMLERWLAAWRRD